MCKEWVAELVGVAECNRLLLQVAGVEVKREAKTLQDRGQALPQPAWRCNYWTSWSRAGKKRLPDRNDSRTRTRNRDCWLPGRVPGRSWVTENRKSLTSLIWRSEQMMIMQFWLLRSMCRSKWFKVHQMMEVQLGPVKTLKEAYWRWCLIK